MRSAHAEIYPREIIEHVCMEKDCWERGATEMQSDMVICNQHFLDPLSKITVTEPNPTPMTAVCPDVITVDVPSKVRESSGSTDEPMRDRPLAPKHWVSYRGDKGYSRRPSTDSSASGLRGGIRLMWSGVKANTLAELQGCLERPAAVQAGEYSHGEQPVSILKNSGRMQKAIVTDECEVGGET